MAIKQGASRITLDLENELIERVDRHTERLGARGVKVTRTDAIRNALDRGLAEAERRAGPQRGDSPKGTKRDA